MDYKLKTMIMDILLNVNGKIAFLNVDYVDYMDIQIGDALECTDSTIEHRKGQIFKCVANDSKIGNRNNKMSKNALRNMSMYGDRFKKLKQ